MTSPSLPVIALIGAPTDCHSSYLRGAALAPAAIRAALTTDHGNAAAESGVELGVDVQIDDAGDVPLADTLGSTADANITNAPAVSIPKLLRLPITGRVSRAAIIAIGRTVTIPVGGNSTQNCAGGQAADDPCGNPSAAGLRVVLLAAAHASFV